MIIRTHRLPHCIRITLFQWPNINAYKDVSLNATEEHVKATRTSLMKWGIKCILEKLS